jgi:hypothetical protein
MGHGRGLKRTDRDLEGHELIEQDGVNADRPYVETIAATSVPASPVKKLLTSSSAVVPLIKLPKF